MPCRSQAPDGGSRFKGSKIQKFKVKARGKEEANLFTSDSAALHSLLFSLRLDHINELQVLGYKIKHHRDANNRPPRQNRWLAQE